MTQTNLSSPETLPPASGYSHVASVPAGGQLVWTSGQVPVKAELTIFVVDTSALPTIRAVRDEVVDVDRPPTSSLVRVAGLFHPDVLIEIEAVAAVSG